MKNVILRFTFLLFFSSSLTAQWQPTEGIYGADVQCALVSGTNTFLGTSNGVYVSPNNGNSWQEANIGLPNAVLANYVSALATNGTTIFAGTQNGVYQSANNGDSWTALNSGMADTYVNALVVSGTSIFAGTNKGLYRSTNNGNNWTLLNNGLLTDTTWIGSIVTKGTNIFLIVPDSGVYVSRNNGNDWTQINNGLSASASLPQFNALAVSGDNIFLQTAKGVYVSRDNGDNWSNLNLPNTLPDTYIYSLVVNGANIFVGTHYNVYVSADGGVSWAIKNQGIQGQRHKVFAGSGTTVMTGTKGGDLFVSSNNGDLWTKKNAGLTNSVNTVAADGGNVLFAGTGLVNGIGGMNNIFVSTNNGGNWTPVTVTPNSYSMRHLAFGGSTAYTIANGNLSYSVNNGNNWTVGIRLGAVYSLAVNGATLFAADDRGVSLSTNNGSSWTAIRQGLDNWTIQKVATSGTNTYAFGVLYENNVAISHGVFSYINSSRTWRRVMVNSKPITTIAVKDASVFVGTEGGGVSVSENDGNNWVEINAGLTNLNITALALLGSNVFAGTREGGVFVSNNNGVNWRAVNEGLINTYISSLNISGNYVCAGTKAGIFRRMINEFLTVGTKDNQDVLSCTISPNPVSNQLIINCSDECIGKKFVIQNILGETISSNNLTENKTAVSLENAPNGVYLLTIIGASKTLKFVKQ
jgi:hypothetical protein